MKIIEQSHEILHMDGLERIEIAGRTCYKSNDKIGCIIKKNELGNYIPPGGECYNGIPTCGPCDLSKCSNHSSHRFVKMLIKRGHEAMIEHGSATVKFITDRGVTHELVRHRTGIAFGQESTRYVNYGRDDIQFIKPVWFEYPALQINANPSLVLKKPGEYNFYYLCEVAEVGYKKLLKDGWQPEHARSVLPNSLKTEIVVTANFREWRHIFKLRAIGTTGKPHPQMQGLMTPVLMEFASIHPALFGDLLEKP